MLPKCPQPSLDDWLQRRSEEKALEWLNEIGFAFAESQKQAESSRETELPNAA